MKWILGFLFLLNIGLFVFMQWGGALTGTAKNGQTLGELNAGKIKLLDMPQPKQIAGSAVPVPLPASAPIHVSAPIPAPVTETSAKACMEWGGIFWHRSDACRYSAI